MKLQDMLQERAKTAHDMREMHKLAEKEDRGFNSDEDQKWSAMSARIDELDGRIEREKRAASLVGITDQQIEDMKPEDVKQMEKKGEVTERQAFSALIRSTSPGLSGLSKDQLSAIKRAQAVGTDSAGGYLVPEGFYNEIVSAMADYSGVEQVAYSFATESGNDLPIPTDDDTGNAGAILAENTQDSEQDITLGVKTLGAYKYTSRIIRVPIELIQDSAFDMDAYLQRKFSERLGRGRAAHFAAGTGSGQPLGINGATSGKTAAAVAAVTFDELLDLKHSVDPVYRKTGLARWFMNDSTFLAVKKLKDGDSRPLWQPDVGSAVPATLDGSPYTIDNGLPDMAASAKPVVYGDPSGYWIRNVKGMTFTRMVERYADYHQIGFVAILRTDADVVDVGKLRSLTMAAS